MSEPALQAYLILERHYLSVRSDLLREWVSPLEEHLLASLVQLEETAFAADPNVLRSVEAHRVRNYGSFRL